MRCVLSARAPVLMLFSALNGVPKRLRGAMRQPAEPEPDHAGGGICERRQNLRRPSSGGEMEDAMKRALALIVALVMSAPPASAAETLTIYTYQSFGAEWGPGPKVKAAFEKQCSCTIQWVAITDGVAILNRLKLEGARTTADVVLGLDTNLTAEARAT